MRAKRIVTVVLALCLAAAFSSTALAAHNSGGDLRLKLKLGGLLQPLAPLGTATYNLQEAVHNTLTDLTGLEIDHSYIWVEADGASILAVDPPRLLFDAY